MHTSLLIAPPSKVSSSGLPVFVWFRNAGDVIIGPGGSQLKFLDKSGTMCENIKCVFQELGKTTCFATERRRNV
jgi:hypothetical protein